MMDTLHLVVWIIGTMTGIALAIDAILARHLGYRRGTRSASVHQALSQGPLQRGQADREARPQRQYEQMAETAQRRLSEARRPTE